MAGGHWFGFNRVNFLSEMFDFRSSLKMLISVLGYTSKPTTGVWWDINTFPIPKDYDPSCVHPSVETALFRLLGPHPVVIYCVGNLEYISRSLLEERDLFLWNSS